MKKAILILSIFLCPIPTFLQAQLLELNDQPHQFVQVNSIQNLNGNKWILGGSTNSSEGKDWYLVSLDSVSMKHPSSNFFDFKSIDQLITSGITGGYALMRDDNTYLSKFLVYPNSILVSNKYTFPEDEEILNIRTWGNGKVIALGRKIVNSEERAFIKIFRNPLTVDFADYSTSGYYSDFIRIDDSTLYVIGSSEGYGGRVYNQYYENQGAILEGVESDRIFKLYPSQSSIYFLLKDRTVTKVGDDFTYVNSVDFESYGKLIDMETDNDFGYLLFQNEGEAPMVLKINISLEVVDFFEVEDEYFIANDMELSYYGIGIAGYLIPNIPFNNTPFLYPSTTGFFKTFSKNGMSTERELDLEIVEVSIEDYEKKDSCSTPDAYQLNLKNIKMTLINRGTKPINHAEFFVEVKGVEECNSSQSTPKYHIQRDELNVVHLDPGDTLRWRISPFEFPQNINDTTAVELCIWLTTIEKQRDVNEEDNYFCGEVLLKEGYVEESIVFPTEGPFLIYPNPLDGIMKVSLLRAPFEPTVIEFYDYVGREVGPKYFIAPRAQYKEFDISELPSGFYFMRISNEIFEEIVRVYVN